MVKWWKLRRLRWLVGTVVLLLATALVAWWRSGASRVMVYNRTGTDIEELTVSACGQSQTFHNLGDGESVRLKLAPTGAASEATVTTNGAVMWHGEYLEPRGGYRAIIRLEAGGEVEASTSISWWQRLF